MEGGARSFSAYVICLQKWGWIIGTSCGWDSEGYVKVVGSIVGTGFKYGGQRSSKEVSVMPEVLEGKVDI